MKRLLPLLLIGWLLTGCLRADAADPVLIIDSGGHTRFVNSLIFTNDGRYLISTGDDKTIRIWNVRTGETARVIHGETGEGLRGVILTAALSPDNKFLAVGGNLAGGTNAERFAIRVYRINDDRFSDLRLLGLLKGHTDRVRALAFSADNHLASGGDFADKSVRIWKIDADPEKMKQEHVLRGHADGVSAIVFSPDGKQLASASDDTTVRLWNWNEKDGDGTPFKELSKHSTEQVYTVAFSPDGRYLVSGTVDKKVLLWDARSGGFIKELARFDKQINKVAFSPGGNQLLIGTSGVGPLILSVPSGEIRARCPRKDLVLAAAFSPDGKMVASTGGYNGEITLWSAETGQVIRELAGAGRTVWSVGFGPDGRSIAFGNKLDSEKPNGYGPLEQLIYLKPEMKGVTGLKGIDEYRVLFGGSLKDGGPFKREIVQVGDYELRTRTGQLLGKEPIIYDPELQVFKKGVLLRTIKRTYSTGRVHRCYTFTHDGRYIISGGANGQLNLYDTETGEAFQPFVGHTSDVWSVAVSPDDKFLVSGSSDQTVRLWDIKSGRNLLTFFVGADDEWVAWTPEGYYTSSMRGDKYIGWKVSKGVDQSPEFYSAEQFQKVFYRPDIISETLKTRDVQLAVQEANTKRYGNLVAYTGDGAADHRQICTFPGQQGDCKQSAATQQLALKIEYILPPTVIIIAPDQEVSEVQERMLPVKLQVLSNTLPITEVSISLNGLPRGTFKGSAKNPEQSRKFEVEMQLALQPGENTLSIVASNQSATSKPEVRKIIYRPAGGPAQKSSRLGATIDPELPAPLAPFSSSSAPAARFQKIYARAGDGVEARNHAAMTRKGVVEPVASDPLKLIINAPTEDNITVRNENFTIGASAFSKTREHVELKVFLNNDANPVYSVSQDSDLASLDQVQLTLKPGPNTIAFTASNGEDPPVTVTRRVTYLPRTSPKPNLVFLGIGISKYEKFEAKLRFADKDTEALAQLFCPQKGDGQLFESVQVMLIPNDQATDRRIFEGLRWLNKTAQFDNDIRIVLIAGHGGVDQDDDYYFYLPPHDMNDDPGLDSIRWDEFWKRLKKPNSVAFFFLDTCYAGAARPRFVAGDPDRSGIAFFAASEADQTASEDPTLQHGIFTAVLLEGLKGKADFNHDKQIDSKELQRWIEDEVKRLTSKEQLPVVQVPNNLSEIPLSSYPQSACPENTQP